MIVAMKLNDDWTSGSRDVVWSKMLQQTPHDEQHKTAITKADIVLRWAKNLHNNAIHNHTFCQIAKQNVQQSSVFLLLFFFFQIAMDTCLKLTCLPLYYKLHTLFSKIFQIMDLLFYLHVILVFGHVYLQVLFSDINSRLRTYFLFFCFIFGHVYPPVTFSDIISRLWTYFCFSVLSLDICLCLLSSNIFWLRSYSSCLRCSRRCSWSFNTALESATKHVREN